MLGTASGPNRDCGKRADRVGLAMPKIPNDMSTAAVNRRAVASAKMKAETASKLAISAAAALAPKPRIAKKR